MNKKILMLTITLLAIAMFAVPVMAKTETPITYTKKRVGPMSVDWRYVGKDHDAVSGSIFQILRSEQAGNVYAGDEAVGDPEFTYTMIGKMMGNSKSGKQVWHFDVVWTITTADGGFKGRLNGDAVAGVSIYTVDGVLQGFGEFKGQKLVVEAERQTPIFAGTAIFSGVLITP